MLQFGKYKGKDLSDVLVYDYQYITWLANNIPDLEKRLDQKDCQFINKIINPVDYIQSKYSGFNKLKEEKALQILKNEGLLQTAYQYIGNDGALNFTIETVYASRFGSTSVMPPFVTADSMNLAMAALQMMKEYSKKHFQKYYEVQALCSELHP